MYLGLTKAQHANLARANAKARGLDDCIHYAPNALQRADALYDAINADGMCPGDTLGLLPDGRMVSGARVPLTTEELYWAFESKARV
jgi:hypothetical protein